MDHITIVRNTP